MGLGLAPSPLPPRPPQLGLGGDVGLESRMNGVTDDSRSQSFCCGGRVVLGK